MLVGTEGCEGAKGTVGHKAQQKKFCDEWSQVNNHLKPYMKGLPQMGPPNIHHTSRARSRENRPRYITFDNTEGISTSR